MNSATLLFNMLLPGDGEQGSTSSLVAGVSSTLSSRNSRTAHLWVTGPAVYRCTTCTLYVVNLL